MSILVVGVNHRSGPLSLLERLTIAPDELGKAVSTIARRDSIREAAVLSTCNRTEIYVVAELFHGAYADVRDFLCELGDLDVHQLSNHLFSDHDEGAVTHLFEVAAGLDSAVLGESEILGQVRTAWEVAQAESAARADLNLLFRSAIATGKRARNETAIARGTASVSHAAVEMLADELQGDLADKRVVVVGAGSMGEGVAIALRKAGGAHITVVNRSPERGAALAERVDGDAVGFDDLADSLRLADVVIAGTGSGRPLITEQLVVTARDGVDSSLHVFDIGLPRDVEESVATLPGVTAYDLDDLRDWADRSSAHRRLEAESVRRIVGDEVENFAVESAARRAAPLVASLRAAAEEIRVGELERFSSRLAALGDAERAAVDALTKAVVAKLLHQPSVQLKTQVGTPQGDRNAAAVRDLFDLG